MGTALWGAFLPMALPPHWFTPPLHDLCANREFAGTISPDTTSVVIPGADLVSMVIDDAQIWVGAVSAFLGCVGWEQTSLVSCQVLTVTTMSFNPLFFKLSSLKMPWNMWHCDLMCVCVTEIKVS